MVKPNVYILGGTQEIDITPIDQNGDFFEPTKVRLSIKQPDGQIITVSGDGLSIVPSGYYFYIYEPLTIGWYQYETAIEHNGRKVAETNGFEVVDQVFPD
jgi:hypothetical protein